MKILQVIPRFNPLHGGGVNVVANHSRIMAKRGHDVTIITTNWDIDIEYVNNLREYGVEIIAFDYLFNYALFIPSPKMKSWLKKNVRNYDIIHMNGARSYQNNIIYLYAIKYRIPYIVQAHGSVRRIAKRKNIKRLYDMVWGNRLLKSCSRAIALCESERESYSKRGVDISKVDIIPNGIDYDLFFNLPQTGEFRRRCKASKNDKIVLYLGRLHVSKGVDLLVESFYEASKIINNIKLILVGPDDGFRSELEKKVKQLELENRVVFMGAAKGYDVIKAFVDSDVFVTPKFFGFPITFAESCACGIPIVTTNEGDYLGWIHDEVGFVVNYNKYEISSAICKIVLNENLRLKFSKQCREIAKDKLDWSNIAKQLEDVYALSKNIF